MQKRMHTTVLSYAIFCLQLILILAQAQERCENPRIRYEELELPFDSTNAHIVCQGTSQPRWFSSSKPCGPFTNSSLCRDGQTACEFSVSDSRNQFYHCCTSGELVNSESVVHCTHIRICTAINEAISAVPPLAFYNEDMVLYIAVYAQSQPNHTAQALFDNMLIENITSMVFQLSDQSPLLAFEFGLHVPIPVMNEVSQDLRFFIDFAAFNSCSTLHSKMYSIPVRSRGTNVTTTPTFSSPPTEGVKQMCDQGLVAVVGILAGVCVLFIVVTVVLVVLLCRRKKRGSTTTPDSTVTAQHYNRLQQQQPSHDSTPMDPSSSVLPPPPLPHSNSTGNGSHSQPPNGTATQSDPEYARPHQPPSNLLMGIGRPPQPSPHTGHTPLITFTPGDTVRSFPNPRSSSAVEEPIMENPSSASYVITDSGSPPPYNTVSAGQSNGHGSPSDAAASSHEYETIYSKKKINILANEVELEEQSTANV